jgi:hypothetical protein
LQKKKRLKAYQSSSFRIQLIRRKRKEPESYQSSDSETEISETKPNSTKKKKGRSSKAKKERSVSPSRKEDPEVTGRKPNSFKKKGSGPKKKKQPKIFDSQRAKSPKSGKKNWKKSSIDSILYPISLKKNRMAKNHFESKSSSASGNKSPPEEKKGTQIVPISMSRLEAMQNSVFLHSIELLSSCFTTTHASATFHTRCKSM